MHNSYNGIKQKENGAESGLSTAFVKIRKISFMQIIMSKYGNIMWPRNAKKKKHLSMSKKFSDLQLSGPILELKFATMIGKSMSMAL